jgi:ABC-2 type transport system ATP-binding protein
MSAPAIIRTEGLTRTFGSVCAVDGLDLEIPSGTVFGFLGPNGAGKTTTIRLLLGLLEPTGGRATVLGFDTCAHGGSIREKSGALLEHHGLYERLSAEDNLTFYARVWRIGGEARADRIRELLQPLGLWERRGEPVGRWSRGMKQKLAVARALLHKPSLLFLDEPTAGLDPVASAALRDDLARLASDEGVTVFLTTHNLAEAERLCARVGVIRKGRLVGFGSPSELREQRSSAGLHLTADGLDDTLMTALASAPGVASATRAAEGAYVTLADPAQVPSLVAWLVAHHVSVHEVRRERASFEEAFLDLVDRAETPT